jgi:hypothetical protein
MSSSRANMVRKVGSEKFGNRSIAIDKHAFFLEKTYFSRKASSKRANAVRILQNITQYLLVQEIRHSLMLLQVFSAIS